MCFFIDRRWRGQGVGTALLEAAVRFAAAQGAAVVEGYPVDPGQRRLPPVAAFTGVSSMFEQAGFREVARRAPTRPIMRYIIPPPTWARPSRAQYYLLRSSGTNPRCSRSARLPQCIIISR